MSVVYVIDNNSLLRECLLDLLGDGGFQCFAYDSAGSFLNCIDAIEQDQGCVVADMWMPDMTGIALLAEIKRRRLSLPVILMSGDDSVTTAVGAMKLGAADFLPKPFDSDTLLLSVREALARSGDLQKGAEKTQIMQQRLAGLTPREVEVLIDLVSGSPNKIIAHHLGLSVRTVEIHRSNLMAKMHAKNLSDLLHMAVLANIGGRQI